MKFDCLEITNCNGYLYCTPYRPQIDWVVAHFTARMGLLCCKIINTPLQYLAWFFHIGCDTVICDMRWHAAPQCNAMHAATQPMWKKHSYLKASVMCCLRLARWLHVVSCGNVQDVFLVDTNKFCFVWIGGGASPAEKKSGLGYAHVRYVTFVVA